MIELAAALLARSCVLNLPELGARSFAARAVPAQFAQFDREVLLAVAAPCGLGGQALRVAEDPDICRRHGSLGLTSIRREMVGWIEALTEGRVAMADVRRIERRATAALLARSDVQCAYRLAPLVLARARPIVVVRLDVIDAVGRQRFLRALWETEMAGTGRGADQEMGALYDELCLRFRQRQFPR